jgi:hypothetical protein
MLAFQGETAGGAREAGDALRDRLSRIARGQTIKYCRQRSRHLRNFGQSPLQPRIPGTSVHALQDER